MELNSNNFPVFDAISLRHWDQYTIKSLPISSIDLMEKAAQACVNYILSHFNQSVYFIFCGVGNNGGDGLAISRLLSVNDCQVNAIICGDQTKGSIDFKDNLLKLKRLESVRIIQYHDFNNEELLLNDCIIIDALFGTGLNQPIGGDFKACIHGINTSPAITIAIDLPSGLSADQKSFNLSDVVIADYTLTFQSPKLCMLLPDCSKYLGKWIVLNIELNAEFVNQQNVLKWYLVEDFVKSLMHVKGTFDHKGNNGHALLIAGSYSKFGALILASKAALFSGLGLLTVHSANTCMSSMHAAVPEAMLSLDLNNHFISDLPTINQYSAIGIGPAIGVNDLSMHVLNQLFQQSKLPLLIDADAITLIAQSESLLDSLPKHSILTPHVKEFERLVGECDNGFDRHAKQIEFSKKHQVYVILKGAYSCLSCPNGVVYFNSTGNEGMAKGGSGDVLSGIITSLLAQKYQPIQAAIIGMYVHGKAGDLAAKDKGVISMIPSDLIEQLPSAFKQLYEGITK